MRQEEAVFQVEWECVEEKERKSYGEESERIRKRNRNGIMQKRITRYEVKV